MFDIIRRTTRSRPILLGYAFGIAAAMSYGSSQFVMRKIASDLAPPPLVAAAFSLLFGAFFLLLLAYRDIPTVKKAPRRGVLYITLAGALASSAVALMFGALTLVPVVVASPIASVQPLVALTLSHLFLQRLERVTLRIVIGAVLVTVGVVLIAVGNA